MKPTRQQLILHVGLPKTGTTTLQRDFFPTYRGYVCGTESTGPANVLANGLHALYQVKGGHRDWTSREWRQEAVEWARTASNVAEVPLLVSLEGLFRWFDPQSQQPWPLMGSPASAKSSRTGVHPLIGFLSTFQESVPHLQLKVAITIRNQSDFLGSLYAQLSYRMPRPSQRDFEKKIEQLITRSDPFLDWQATIENIRNLVGHENTKVLLFEDGVEKFGRELAFFVNPDWKLPPGVPGRRHNARSNSTDSWELTTQRTWLEKSFTRIRWPISKRRDLRRASGPEGPPNNVVKAKEGHDQTLSVHVSNELRKAVQDTYARANSVLAAHLNRDLIIYGY